MKENFEKYIQSVSEKFSHPETSEMGYRSDFEELLNKVFFSIPKLNVLHDAKSQRGNKPDFIVLKDSIPILYLEVKNIGISLDKIEKSEQMTRYFGYTNLVLSDYLEFRFYRNGIRYGEPIKTADFDSKNRTVRTYPENYEFIARTLIEFTESQKEPIRSGEHLAKIMGGKAQRIRDNVRQFLSYESEKNVDLEKIYETIKKLLVHDLTKENFGDMYAQTLVYGLFAARYYDNSPGTFSRQEARDLIPNSNPLLRHFFDHIVGPDFDKRLEYIVNELCEVFSHADVASLLEDYFKKSSKDSVKKGPDPVIHFYEDFLKEYDPDLRKKMGAYYTPLPIVNFIVRSVDQILKKEFGLSNGLADTSKLENGLHKVQVLDPATGTGTFISSVIRTIYESILKRGQKGSWPAYVHRDLLPRIYGFELMMAPYTIAHLKLGIAFKQTGFWDFHRRLGIYLTNSLEESPAQIDMFMTPGFGESIAEESKEAAIIKNEKPIMVVVGNPPYSVSSSNKGVWIQNLIKVYKENLNEKKLNLDDDYIKFIRFAEHFIEKNGTGIVAVITNNSFIDGITHRQMRKHLLETFDDIYILDLHGNSKKKEKALQGGKDENVFNIQQGVAISIFVRKSHEKRGLGKVHHESLQGTRENKFATLDAGDLQSTKWSNIDYTEPNYFFVPRSTVIETKYLSGFSLPELMPEYNSGIQSKRDKICFTFTSEELEKIVGDFEQEDAQIIRTKYALPEDGRDWTIKWAQDDLRSGYQIKPVLYRPFDIRMTAYTGKSKGFLAYPREKTSKHFVGKENLALITVRQQSTFDFQHVLATKWMIESGAISLQTKEWGYIFPLYLYTDYDSRTPNLKGEIVALIEEVVGKTTPENIFDFIYAVLHSPSYRKRYKELLKIDFPRVPYPNNKESFNKLVKFGTDLRELHLLESPKITNFITTYPVAGSDAVEKAEYKEEKVLINSQQYFGKVPEIAWNFWIGGYQPAQKWLKDRKGRTLTNEDIEHYQKIIVALAETDKVMKQIDKNGF
ncbi:MAG TPA: type ISP restriction/modification enzyme [Candidatus Saccharimonadales bacterium]|nr:type ISP restriction/modification enzyme [Candidatus Saccharimonadales bacterium]